MLNTDIDADIDNFAVKDVEQDALQRGKLFISPLHPTYLCAVSYLDKTFMEAVAERC